MALSANQWAVVDIEIRAGSLKMPFNQTPDEIAKAFSVSRKTIERRVKDGTFKYGKHYIDLQAKNAKDKILRFNLEACQKVFLTPPEKR